jgi:hypothetical protein
MNYANSEKFYTCMATPDLSVIQRFIVPDIVQKFQRPFANPELGYGKITRILIRTQLCVPIQIKVLVREKKKVHTLPAPPPQMSCILCLRKKKDKKKKDKKNQKRKKKQKQINKQTKKMQVIFLPDSEAPLLPMQCHGFLYYTYICVLVGKACRPEEVSLHVLVLVTNFYIANVG